MTNDGNNLCSDCLFSFKSLENRQSKETGFMGFTHALSAVAVTLVLLAFVGDFFAAAFGTSTNIPTLLLVILVLAGSALLPDLDNSRSTAESALGFLGNPISEAVRFISRVIQVTLRTKYDDPDPNPHRGAFHAPSIAILLGFLTFLLINLPGKVSIPILGEMTWGKVSAIILTWILIHIAFSGLFKAAMKSIKSSSILGELIAMGLSLGTTYLLFNALPVDESLVWLPISLAAGMIVHDLGDSFTTAGDPLFAPIPIRGKIWYNVRIPPHIRAGGAAENWLFIPLFSILIIVSLTKIGINLLGGGS